MSYCRFGGADVYVFASSGALECCGCPLQDVRRVESDEAFFGFYYEAVEPIIETRFGGPDANADMVAHLRRHQEAGDYVPEDVFERLADPQDAEYNQRLFAEHHAEGTSLSRDKED